MPHVDLGILIYRPLFALEALGFRVSAGQVDVERILRLKDGIAEGTPVLHVGLNVLISHVVLHRRLGL